MGRITLKKKKPTAMNRKYTQKQKVLRLFKERGGRGVKVFDLISPKPDGLQISQYGRVIKELREEGYNIINKQPGLFVLSGYENVENSPKQTMKLEGEAKMTWEQMGAWLKGNAPKPETGNEFKKLVERELF